jgi:hypothetical protein
MPFAVVWNHTLTLPYLFPSFAATSFTVAPDFPADLRVWTIRSFNGAPKVRAFALATAIVDTRCFPFRFAHRAFIAAEILALAEALILPFFGREAPFFTGVA